MINNILSKFGYVLAQPIFLWLLLLVPAYIWYKWYQKRSRGEVWILGNIATNQFDGQGLGKRFWWPTIAMALALTLMVVALARPQKTDTQSSINSEGIDIVLSIDVSGSMLAEDFKPNRLEAAKEISQRFVQERIGDRIGVVVFSGESFSQCPITLDHKVVLEQLSQLKSGILRDGTAIGNGLATAVDRLRLATGKSKIVILMTDGVNGTLGGTIIDPNTALEIAKAYGVKVYTVGIGTRGKALMPIPTATGVVRQMVDVEIDEALLQKIAKETGGAYYRATDNSSLREIYNKIDKLEKTKVTMDSYKQYEDKFHAFVFAAIVLLILALLMQSLVWRSITQ